jgi:hypothetical protein
MAIPPRIEMPSKSRFQARCEQALITTAGEQQSMRHAVSVNGNRTVLEANK